MSERRESYLKRETLLRYDAEMKRTLGKSSQSEVRVMVKDPQHPETRG